MDKWKIKEYTLPQIVELMRETNKHIQFEVTTRFNPLSMFGGAPQAGDETDTKTEDDADYVVMDEEGVNLLSRALGGG